MIFQCYENSFDLWTPQKGVRTRGDHGPHFEDFWYKSADSYQTLIRKGSGSDNHQSVFASDFWAPVKAFLIFFFFNLSPIKVIHRKLRFLKGFSQVLILGNYSISNLKLYYLKTKQFGSTYPHRCSNLIWGVVYQTNSEDTVWKAQLIPSS